MARRKNKKFRPVQEVYVIVVDGETEVWYFQMLLRNEPNLKVRVLPRIPQKRRLSDQYKNVLVIAADATQVFWIIDLDKLVQESRLTKKGVKSPIQEFKEYQNVILNKYSNITIIINNPCFEYWILLHYKSTTKNFNNCAEVEKELKKHLPDYEKTRNYYIKQNNDIYARLKQRLPEAIKNSRKTKRNINDNFNKGICEMSVFFEDDRIKEHVLPN